MNANHSRPDEQVTLGQFARRAGAWRRPQPFYRRLGLWLQGHARLFTTWLATGQRGIVVWLGALTAVVVLVFFMSLAVLLDGPQRPSTVMQASSGTAPQSIQASGSILPSAMQQAQGPVVPVTSSPAVRTSVPLPPPAPLAPVEIPAGRTFDVYLDAVAIYSGDVAVKRGDGSVEPLYDNASSTGLVVVVPRGSSFSLVAPYGGSARVVDEQGTDALTWQVVSEMTQGSNCGGAGCERVEVVKLDRNGSPESRQWYGR